MQIRIGLMKETFLSVGDLPVDMQKEVIDKCESAACKGAKRQLIPVRNEIYGLCSRIAEKVSKRNVAAGIATALLTAAIALTIGAATSAATWWGIPAAAFMLIAAAVLYGSAGAATIAAAAYEREVGRLRGLIAALQAKWDGLVDTVTQSCPEYCWPDLDVPRCTDKRD